MTRLKSAAARLAGAALLAYLVFGYIGIDTLAGSLGSVAWPYLLAVVPFHLAQWWLRTLRWRMLLDNEGIRLPRSRVFALATAGFFLGCWTPGRVGEFVKVKFLMNAGHGFRPAFLASLIERLLDLAALGAFVLAGALVCLPLFPQEWLPWIAALLAAAAGLAGVVLRFKGIGALWRKLIPERLAGSVDAGLALLKASLLRVPPRRRAWIAALSLAVWGLNYWMIYLLFLGAGFSVPPGYAFAFASIGSLAGLLPISIYGAGIREAVLIGLFHLLRDGDPQARVEGLMFGLMFLVLLLYHIALGFVCWSGPWMRPFLNQAGEAGSTPPQSIGAETADS